ncbi:MAG: hypothetical protein E7171_08080 [Firmicutes bacterium]|nr:hypothetical protein [Bacillota bacterium]
MNKLFKLIYVNLLSLFDINKIIIAREDGVKSSLEKRVILVALINVVYAYFLYVILNKLVVTDKSLLLVIGFFVSTILCFSSDLSVVEQLIFKSDDTEFLFSYPVSRNQILFSKLFTVYLKNLVTTALFMIVSFLAYYNSGGIVTDTLFVMVLLVSLTIPILPIIISTIISYIDDYYKTKTHSSIVYKIIKTIILIIIFLIVIILFSSIKSDSMNDIIKIVVNKLYWIYPMGLIFHAMLVKESIFLFIILLLIPIIVSYLYSLIISNNYLKICSLLKGVKTSNKFVMKKSKKLNKSLGLFRKEIISLFKNKVYLTSSFGYNIVLTILLILICNVIDFNMFKDIENINIYINLYVPTLLALFGSIGCSTISSMSLEKDNMQILRTLPVSMAKILWSKWLVNIVIGTIFVIINGTVISLYLDIDKWSIMFSFLIPFLALVFVSLTGLVLDYRFIEKNETEDNAIVRQRLITMVPLFISLCIGIVPFFMPVYSGYRYLLGAYVVVLIVFIVVDLLYLLINKNKLLSNLFK